MTGSLFSSYLRFLCCTSLLPNPPPQKKPRKLGFTMWGCCELFQSVKWICFVSGQLFTGFWLWMCCVRLLALFEELLEMLNFLTSWLLLKSKCSVSFWGGWFWFKLVVPMSVGGTVWREHARCAFQHLRCHVAHRCNTQGRWSDHSYNSTLLVCLCSHGSASINGASILMRDSGKQKFIYSGQFYLIPKFVIDTIF
jgi:hypothetical protein